MQISNVKNFLAGAAIAVSSVFIASCSKTPDRLT